MLIKMILPHNLLKAKIENDDEPLTILDQIELENNKDQLKLFDNKTFKAVINIKDGKLLMKAAYKLHDKYEFAGLPISIENKKGSQRNWKDSDGNEGKTLMKYDYGYIRSTEGRDGDHVDCFIGDNEDCENVYIVHQVFPDTGKYDEDKVMIGFENEDNAKQSYLDHYDNPKFFGSITTMTMDKFKERVFKTLNSQKKSLKALMSNIRYESLLKAGKKYDVGSISEKTGKKKVAPGKWVKVGKDGKEEKPKGTEPKEDKKDPKKKGDKAGMSKIKDAMKSAMKTLVESFTDYFSGHSGAQELAHGTKDVGEKLKKKPDQTKKVEPEKKPENDK